VYGPGSASRHQAYPEGWCGSGHPSTADSGSMKVEPVEVAWLEGEDRFFLIGGIPEESAVLQGEYPADDIDLERHPHRCWHSDERNEAAFDAGLRFPGGPALAPWIKPTATVTTAWPYKL
jgi:hypothetical protein